MKKIMNAIAVSTTLGCVAATSYFIMKNKKKNMLDIIIEDIDSFFSSKNFILILDKQIY